MSHTFIDNAYTTLIQFECSAYYEDADRPAILLIINPPIGSGDIDNKMTFLLKEIKNAQIYCGTVVCVLFNLFLPFFYRTCSIKQTKKILNFPRLRWRVHADTGNHTMLRAAHDSLHDTHTNLNWNSIVLGEFNCHMVWK